MAVANLSTTLWSFRLNNFFFTVGSFFLLEKKYRVSFSLLNYFFPSSFFYVKSKQTYNYILRKFVISARSYFFNSRLVGFRWFRFVLFSGLGYKRRFFKKYGLMFTYIGDRHWILLKLGEYSVIAPNRRRNFVFFSPLKGQFAKDYNFFSSLRTPQVYKMKGFLDTRVRGRFLFVRRIKIRGVRTKLSKKQKLL